MLGSFNAAKIGHERFVEVSLFHEDIIAEPVGFRFGTVGKDGGQGRYA